jgi:hypothetical protein
VADARLQESGIVEPAELLHGSPETWPGANKLIGVLKAASALLAQEIDQEVHRMPTPPSNIQADIDAKQRTLKALDEKVAELSETPGEGALIGPALEQRALERLFEVGVRRERELASDLDEDAWDVAAWCDTAEGSGLIEQMGSSMAPLRHWSITDKGRESIGYPSAR